MQFSIVSPCVSNQLPHQDWTLKIVLLSLWVRSEYKCTVCTMDLGLWTKTKNSLKCHVCTNPRGTRPSSQWHKVTRTDVFYSEDTGFLSVYVFFWHMECWEKISLNLGDFVIVTNFQGKKDDCSDILITLLLSFLVIIHSIAGLGLDTSSRLINRNIGMAVFKLRVRRDPRVLVFSQ